MFALRERKMAAEGGSRENRHGSANPALSKARKLSPFCGTPKAVVSAAIPRIARRGPARRFGAAPRAPFVARGMAIGAIAQGGKLRPFTGHLPKRFAFRRGMRRAIRCVPDTAPSKIWLPARRRGGPARRAYRDR